MQNTIRPQCSFWQPFLKMDAKAHIDIILSGPIARNYSRHIVYYLDRLNHSIIIDFVSIWKILCGRSVLLAAIL